MRQLGHEFEGSHAAPTCYYSEYRSYGEPSHLQRSTSISTSGYYNRPTRIYDERSAFDSSTNDYHGHNYHSSNSTNDSLHYQEFGYYHKGKEFKSNLTPLPYFNHDSSSALSNLKDVQHHLYISPHSHEENQVQMPYSYFNRSKDKYNF